MHQLALQFTAPAPARASEPDAHSQLARVRRVLADGQWHTLAEIAARLGIVSGNTTGVSARIRDLRKPQHGAHVIEGRPRAGMGEAKVFEYRMGC